MKKLFLMTTAIVALATVGATANAADLAYKAAPLPIPVYSWSGCYIGGHVGYGKGQTAHNFQFDDVTPDFNTAEYYFNNDFNNSGAVGGLQGGCNYQTGHFVVGIEGDYSWANLKGSYSFADPAAADSASFSSNIDRLSSIRARFGLAEDRALVYITMGFAWAHTKYSYALNDSDTAAVAANYGFTSSGMVAGAGAAYALTDSWSVRAEYLHYMFGSNNDLLPSFPAFDTGPGYNDHFKVRTVDVIRVGLDWKFNWGKAPAVVTKY
jgi:outer membrane immunogenic protein